MNKTELVRKVSSDTGVTKKIAAAVTDAVFDAISEALACGEKVQIAGFGTFVTRTRAARIGRNPRSGGEIQLPAAVIPAFKAGKALKDKVNK